MAQDTASRVISGAVLDPTDREVPAATLKLARREAKGQAKVNATAAVINEMVSQQEKMMANMMSMHDHMMKGMGAASPDTHAGHHE